MTFNYDTRWTYTRNPENTRWIIDSAPAHAIACTAGYACDDEDVARLIAAAPDLLAAAQIAFETLAPLKDDDFVWAAMSQLMNAIAKAKGETT